MSTAVMDAKETADEAFGKAVCQLIAQSTFPGTAARQVVELISIAERLAAGELVIVPAGTRG
jgi:hypothetical protein